MGLLLAPRYLAALPVATLLVGVAIGIPTDVLPNPWFTRMTPVRTLDLILWPLTSVVLGALLATYVLRSHTPPVRPLSQSAGGGLLSAFAIGCPVCNKLIVAILGFSGALTYFEPVQPVLGVAAVALGAYGLRRRVLDLTSGCPTPNGRLPEPLGVDAHT